MPIAKGAEFSHWTTTGNSKVSAHGEVYYECICACGTKKYILRRYLTRGVSKSCGCRKSELIAAAGTTHGHSRSATYTTWNMMRQRCENTSHAAYKNYGGRGISVNPAWREFTVFLSDMGPRPPGAVLDRVDNDGNYCKENCRWIPRGESGENTRVAMWWRIGTHEYRSRAAAAKALGHTRQTISRWCRGWTDRRSGKHIPAKPGCGVKLKYSTNRKG